jgi:methionine sulfoxide reductase catalytic subunit
MLIKVKKSWALRENDVTPHALYLNRRQILAGAGFAAAAMAMPKMAFATPFAKAFDDAAKTSFGQDEVATSYEDITRYNNFYEFGTDKADPKKYAHKLTTSPWTINVEGECAKPGRYDLEDILKGHTVEERIYRLRCVEAWSMVIPWNGIPMGDILARFEPNSNAKYVQFDTLYRPEEMWGQNRRFIGWPYQEALRMDEAMHPLTLAAIGLYGDVLPKQNGAPIRLVVPWKYGFKSIKSIVGIRFTEKRPKTSWNQMNSREYGFYANVNPSVDHPRWAQDKERRIGDFFKTKTRLFNGYASEVASLYDGLNLRHNY